MTRCDFPQTVIDLLNVATAERILDVACVYELATNHGENWGALVKDVCEVAFTQRLGSSQRYERVVKAAEAYWRWAHAQSEVASV